MPRNIGVLCNDGEWPRKFMKSTIVHSRKNGAKECANFRTSNLVVQASKIVLKIWS